MHPQNKRAQVLEEPMPQGNAGNGPEQLTRVVLCQTIGELIRLGYVEPHFKNDSDAAKQVVRYRLTEKRP